MSEENLDIYRRAIEAFNREGVEGAMRYFDRDAEVYDPDAPADRPYRGREAVAAFLSQLVEGTGQIQVRDFDLIPAGDRVVGLIHAEWRSEGGETEIELRDAHTLTFRDGKIVYWRAYLDRDEALADAGLDPDQLARVNPAG
jgi:ketosteroid isomerase-like protein